MAKFFCKYCEQFFEDLTLHSETEGMCIGCLEAYRVRALEQRHPEWRDEDKPREPHDHFPGSDRQSGSRP